MLKKSLLSVLIAIGACNLSFGQQTPNELSSDHMFLRGLELIDKSKYAAARQAFQEYLNKNDNSIKAIDAEYYIAYSALNLFNADAELRFDNFVEKYPSHPKAILANYELGNFYYNQRKYDKAIVYLSKVNSDQLTSEQKVEAAFKLGYSYFTKKNFDKAGASFNKIKNSNHKYTAPASYYAGYIEFLNNEYDAALTDLSRAEKDATYKPLIPVLLTGIYYRQNEFDKVISYGEKVLNGGSKVSESGEMALLVAEAYNMKGDYNKAAERYNQYTADNKASITSPVQYRVGYANFMANNNDKAIDNFKQVATKDDTLGQYAAYHLGLSYLKNDNKQFAISAFEQAAKKEFDQQIKEQATFYSAKVNYDQGRFREAIPLFKDFLSTFSNSEHTAEANALLSEAYLNTDNYDEAIRHIESLSKRSKRVNAAYQRLTFYKGVQLFNDSRFPEAIQMFEKSLRNPEDQEIFLGAHFWAAEAYSINGQYPEAVNNYAVIFRTPNSRDSQYHLKSRYGIGYAYYNQKEYDKALIHFKEYVNTLEIAATKQYYEDALIRLADCYYVTKNYSEALRLYDKAIDIEIPERDYAYFQKGVIMGINNRYEEAKSAFTIIIEQFSNSRYKDNAIFQRAQLDFEKGAYAAAISGFSKLLDASPNSALVPNAYLKRAISYNNIKDYNNAASDYKRILNEYPAHKTANSALLGLQEALTATGNIDEFNDYLDRYKRANPSNDALESIEFETAKSLYFSQKYPKAIKALKDYINSYPNTPLADEAKYYLAESHYRSNDFTNALINHKEIIKDNRSATVNKSVARAAELEYAAKNYNTSINYYRRLLNTARSKKEQSNAWVGLVENYFNTAKYDSVNYYAGEILNGGNVSLDAQNKAYLYSGKAAYAQGDLAKATDDFINTLNSAKDQNGAEAQYLMAEIQYKQKNYKQSLETLYDLNKNFAAYSQWLDKSFLLIADNFIALNENFQAKATLNSIIEKSADSATKEVAKAKLATIQDKKSAEKDTVTEQL
jgi:TolA-binding protein